MEQKETLEVPAERDLFETIRTTYALALEPEQHAMVKQLRDHLPTVPAGERQELINSIQEAIGRNVEEEFEY